MTTSKTKKSVQLSVGGIVLIAVISLCVSMFAVERIDSGQTGIIVNLAGSERGVDDAKVETGWGFYNRFTKQLFEYPAFAQIVDYEPFDIQDKKGTIFKTDPTIEYYIERENAKIVFLRYRKTTEELEQSVILTEVKNAYKDIAGLYETDSLINNRPAFEKEVETLLKERLSQRGFTFSNIQSSVKPNDVLQAAIDAKNTAVQNALKVENEKKAAGSIQARSGRQTGTGGKRVSRTKQDLQMLQALPLNLKTSMTKARIRQWVNEFGEEGVYVSFSLPRRMLAAAAATRPTLLPVASIMYHFL